MTALLSRPLFCVCSLLAGASPLAAETTLRSDRLVVTVDQGRYAVQAQGQGAPFASGALACRGAVRVVPVEDPAFGKGQALTIQGPDGADETLELFEALPFVLHRVRLVNAGTQARVLNKVPLTVVALALGRPAEQLVVLGTGGLKPLPASTGSYAWMAVAEPASGAGVVGGWLTQERGSGVVFTRAEGTGASLEARLEYGSLRLEPGQGVASETFLLGWFADARLGLEAWADAVAKRLAIQLPAQPVVYCTWYDDRHDGPSDAKAIAQLSGFAARTLRPYGFSCVQIDDGWQAGDARKNGPNKNFSAHNPRGPYPLGMKPTAEGIRADGLTPGLWLLPFGGTWNDPFFAPHPDWFVQTADGRPFDTAWGGTALDMTHPGARAFVRGEIRQAVHDWGYRYLKLDGLSTGIGVQPQYVNDAWKEDHLGEGVFHDPSRTPLEAFRDGLRLIREAAGPETFLLGCCAPQNMRSYAGVFGLVDAMRMGPDNAGTWEDWCRASPVFGSRNYHLNGRLWWSDPDPIYVRAAIPLDSARCIASWNALAGQMLSLSDWLPDLPPERLDLLRRCMPGHGVTARPVDLFTAQVPRIWLVSDERPDHQRRDVLGLYNWGATPDPMEVSVARLGLPPASSYLAYDFWEDQVTAPFSATLKTLVPAMGCRVLAIRPLLARPFLLSTSRHVSQGILEVRGERWEEAAGALEGTSAVVGGDGYELRIFAPGAWQVAGVELAEEDRAAGAVVRWVGTAGGLVRVRLEAPGSRDVRWRVRFHPLPAPDA